ncbi:MAG: DUF1080 domain-containing protein [Planctomycetota bacterium]
MLSPRHLFLTASLFTSLVVAQQPEKDAKETAPQAAPVRRPIFDGKSLEGWTPVGGHYDGKAQWTVEDGAIVGRSGENKAGGLLYTTQTWHSFDVTMRTRIDWPFDSGVFVRMAPAGKGGQVTLDWREGGEIGGIYADGWLQHNAEGAAKFKRDAWNDIRVRCTGRDYRLEFWLNGEKLTDYRLPVGSEGYAPTGLLGLQVHPGGESDTAAARFEHIELVELPVFDLAEFDCDEGGFLSPKKDRGWEPLLDDKLSKWDAHGGDGAGFVCDGKVLSLLTQGSAGDLRTKADYRDFVLRLDFKVLRHANSGVFLRAARTDADPAYSGCEIQVLDDFHWEEDNNYKLKPWQFSGSLYGSVPAGHKGALYPLGCWNTYEIRFQGGRLRCELNGVELYDVDTLGLKPEQGEPFAKRVAEGFLGLQRHAPGGKIDGDAYAWYRNVFVKRL